MGYSYKSEVTRNAPRFTEPLSEDLLVKGAIFQEQNLQKSASDYRDAYGSMFGITPMSEQDAKVLAQRKAEFDEATKNLNISNLRDPQTKAQINSIVNQFKNDPDILGIGQRSLAEQREVTTKKEYEAKGLRYTSPIIDQADDYRKNGVYLRDTKFNQSGWLSPEIEKLKGEALKNVQKVSKPVKIGNYWTTVESYDDDALKSTLSELYNRPDIQKDFQYRFDRINKDKDWETEGMQDLQNDLDKANVALSIDPNDEKAQSFIEKYSPLLNNPGKLGENVKNRYKQDAINQMIQEDILASDYESYGKMDADDFTLKAVEHRDRLIEKQAYDLSMGASLNGWSLQETLQDPNKMQKALADSQSAKLAEFSQKENIKLQNKISAKNNAVKGGFKFTDSDTISYVDEAGDTKTLQYGTFKDEILKAPQVTAQRMIAAALNQKNATDGNWIPITPEQVKVSGVGDKRKVKINSTYGFGGEAIPIDDVIDISNFIGGNTQDPNTVTYKSPTGGLFTIPLSDKAAIDSATARGYIKQ